MKKQPSVGMMFLCKKVQQNQWTRQNNFARMYRVAQEAKSERARSGFIRYKRPRYRCQVCKKTLSARAGTMMEGLRTDEKIIITVVTLLAYGCPPQAIVHAYGLDERIVADWQKRAGNQSKRVHEVIVEQGYVKSHHIQADEIRAKGRKVIIWMVFAMDISTRLWMAGVVSHDRDRPLIDRLFQHVRACCHLVQSLLVCTDGFAAYPKSIVRAFREKVKRNGERGRCRLQVWPDLCIATVIKHTKKKRVVEVTRKMTRGALKKAQELLGMTKGGSELNTAFIERLNLRRKKHEEGLGKLLRLVHRIGWFYQECHRLVKLAILSLISVIFSNSSPVGAVVMSNACPCFF